MKARKSNCKNSGKLGVSFHRYLFFTSQKTTKGFFDPSWSNEVIIQVVLPIPLAVLWANGKHLQSQIFCSARVQAFILARNKRYVQHSKGGEFFLSFVFSNFCLLTFSVIFCCSKHFLGSFGMLMIQQQSHWSTQECLTALVTSQWYLSNHNISVLEEICSALASLPLFGTYFSYFYDVFIWYSVNSPGRNIL